MQSILAMEEAASNRTSPNLGAEIAVRFAFGIHAAFFSSLSESRHAWNPISDIFGKEAPAVRGSFANRSL